MPFHVRLILLLAALGTKITELSDKLKQYECECITKAHFKRNVERTKIDRDAHAAQIKAYNRARTLHARLDGAYEDDDELYIILKGEA